MPPQHQTAPSRQVGRQLPLPSQSPQDQPSSLQPRQASNAAPGITVVPSTQNPFSRQSLIAKRQEIIAQLREERANEGQRPQSEQSHQNGEPRQDAQAPSNQEKPAEKPAASENQGDPQRPPPQAPSQELLDLERRHREVEAAQKKVAEAQTEIEKQRAMADQSKKEAQAALQELEWAKNEPVEFLAKIGMKDEEWKDFLTRGGKQSPETKRFKAMEERYKVMEARQKALEEKAERAAYDARIQQENTLFANQLEKYTFVPRLGGLPQVRLKQQQLSRASGSFISLRDAADALEKELHDGLKPLLNHEDVRTKLGLADRHHSSVDESPSGSTQNGQADAKASKSEVKEEDPKPWDWAAKKRRALQLLAQSSIGGS